MKTRALIFSILFLSLSLYASENPLVEAEKLFRSGQEPKAKQIVSHFITTNDSAHGYIMVGHLFARLKRWADSVHYLEIATTREERNAEAWYDLGLAYHQNKQIDKAVEALRKSISISSTTLKSFMALGEILELAHFRLDARNVYSEALKKIGDKPELRAKLCRLNYLDSYFPETIKHCTRAVTLDPRDVTSWTLLAQTYYDNQQRDQAFKTFKTALSKFPRAAFPLRARGLIYFSEKSYEQAVHDLGFAFGLDPQDDEAAIHLARSEFELGQYERALPIFIEACKLDRRNRFELVSKQRELVRKGKEKLAEAYDAALEKI